jgi:hypothetical protein
VKTKRTVYPVVVVTFMLDDGAGSLHEVAGMSGSVRGLTVDISKGGDVLTAQEFAHVVKKIGRFADDATDTFNVMETEEVRGDF